MRIGTSYITTLLAASAWISESSETYPARRRRGRRCRFR